MTDCPNLCSGSKEHCEWCKANSDVSHEYYTAKRVLSGEWVTGYLVKDKETQKIEGILNSANDFAECAFIDESTLRLFEVEPYEDNSEAQTTNVFSQEVEKDPVPDYGVVRITRKRYMRGEINEYTLATCLSINLQYRYRNAIDSGETLWLDIKYINEYGYEKTEEVFLEQYNVTVEHKGEMTITF